LSGRHGIQAAAGNAGWLVADKLFRLGCGLIVNVWVARYLGPPNFGLLNFAMAFVALFSIISNLGLQNVIVRDLVTAPDRREELLASALAMRVAGSAVAVILAVVAVVAMRPGDIVGIRVVSIVALMLVPQAWDIIEFDYQARIEARPIVIIRSASFVLASLLKIFLILNAANVTAFAWITTAEIVFSSMVMSLFARKRGKLPRLRNATVREVRYLLRTSWPLMVSGLSVVLYWRIDQVMLGQLVGDAGVGLFSAAVRVSEVWYFIPIALASSSAPILTAIYSRSRTEFLEKLTELTRLMAALGVVVAIGLSIFAKTVVSVLYGPDYLSSSTILAIHAWAGVFVAIGVVSSSWFINSGLFNHSMYQTLTGAICNIGLNSLLIPRYAGIGAAIATVVSQIFATILLNALAPRTRELFRLQISAFIPHFPGK
jgi:PST family polysaccharide transporter